MPKKTLVQSMHVQKILKTGHIIFQLLVKHSNSDETEKIKKSTKKIINSEYLPFYMLFGNLYQHLQI